MILREGIRYISIAVMRLFTRTTIIGKENLPAEGAVILATNHLSWLDAPLIYTCLYRRDTTALVAKKYQQNPVVRWLVDGAQATWIDRTTADYEALRAALKLLNKGWMVGIAPEGTRSPDHKLMGPKPGVAYLATKAKVPIIPIALSGTETILPLWRKLKRPELILQFGKPFDLPPVDRKNREDGLERNADEIMCQIAVLLPPNYRGVYSSHARLQELLLGSPAQSVGENSSN
jgi:1-acyl-sn-glycerol-3-phosphate acyltransferase